MWEEQWRRGARKWRWRYEIMVCDTPRLCVTFPPEWPPNDVIANPLWFWIHRNWKLLTSDPGRTHFQHHVMFWNETILCASNCLSFLKRLIAHYLYNLVPRAVLISKHNNLLFNEWDVHFRREILGTITFVRIRTLNEGCGVNSLKFHHIKYAGMCVFTSEFIGVNLK